MILSASHVGFPLSTTQVMSGAIMGAGAAKRLSAVRWGVAGNIVLAWVLTLPCSAAVGAFTYAVVRLFGDGLRRADRGRRGAAARAWSCSRPGGLRLVVVVGAGDGVIEDILEVIVVSAGRRASGSPGSYSFVVLGAGRSAEARRSRRVGAPRSPTARMAALFLLVFAAGVVLAVQDHAHEGVVSRYSIVRSTRAGEPAAML